MINKIKRWKWNFNKLVVLFDLCYFILFNTINISEPVKYISALILVILNAVFLFTKKKASLLKSLALLHLINVPIWIVVIFLVYSKYQSLPFQIIAFALVFISFTSIITFILLVINRIIEAGKLKITIAVLMLFVVLCFIISTFAYQRLVNEGSIIADKQCLKVNPLIIERKNSYIKSVKIVFAKGSEGDYMNEFNNYMDISKKYIEEEAGWLREQEQFMNKWDYNFFLPPEIKAEAQLQYTLREADMKGTQAIIDMYKTTDPNRQKEYIKIVIDQTKIANEADKKSDILWKTKPKFDPRVRFVKVPPTKCPKKNFDIPNVMDFLTPPKPIRSGPVTYNFDFYRSI